jgi:Transposase DDE domain
LHNAAIQANENLQLRKEDPLTILADKGYHTGAELYQCQQENMTTHVAYKEQPSVKHIANEFLSESFEYNKATDSYTCPAGATQTSLGTWHNKRGEANETSYQFKTYRTDACKTCPLKSQCTKLPKRIIHRSELAYRQAGTRMRWTSMTTISNKTHSITNEDRPSANIPSEPSNVTSDTHIR